MESRNFSIGVNDMFRLRDLKNGLFQIHKKNGPAYEGTPRVLFTKAVQLGLPETELSTAVNQLNVYKDDYADFSGSGKLLYTKKNGDR